MEKQAKQLATAFSMFKEMGIYQFLQFLNSNFKKRKAGTISLEYRNNNQRITAKQTEEMINQLTCHITESNKSNLTQNEIKYSFKLTGGSEFVKFNTIQTQNEEYRGINKNLKRKGKLELPTNHKTGN